MANSVRLCIDTECFMHFSNVLFSKESTIIKTVVCLGIYLYTYKTLIVLIDWLLEAVRTNSGYGMATVIYNNLLNLILGTVILLRSS